MELLTPGIGLIFWQVVIFLLLVVLLGVFAWRPILDSLKIREESIEEALRSADEARQEMSKLQADNEKLLAKAREERDVLLKEAAKIAGQLKEEAKEDAKKITSKLIEDAQASIVSEKEAALKEVRNLVAELSVEIAEKLIRKSLGDAKSQKALVDEFLAKSKSRKGAPLSQEEKDYITNKIGARIGLFNQELAGLAGGTPGSIAFDPSTPVGGTMIPGTPAEQPDTEQLEEDLAGIEEEVFAPREEDVRQQQEFEADRSRGAATVADLASLMGRPVQR